MLEGETERTSLLVPRGDGSGAGGGGLFRLGLWFGLGSSSQAPSGQSGEGPSSKTRTKLRGSPPKTADWIFHRTTHGGRREDHGPADGPRCPPCARVDASYTEGPHKVAAAAPLEGRGLPMRLPHPACGVCPQKAGEDADEHKEEKQKETNATGGARLSPSYFRQHTGHPPLKRAPPPTHTPRPATAGCGPPHRLHRCPTQGRGKKSRTAPTMGACTQARRGTGTVSATWATPARRYHRHATVVTPAGRPVRRPTASGEVDPYRGPSQRRQQRQQRPPWLDWRRQGHPQWHPY